MKRRFTNPPIASSSKSDDPILAAWKSQLARAAKKPWLASLLLQRSRLIFRRFAHYYRLLRVLPRRTRRRFLKGAASTLGSLALLLALSGTPSLAANIAVTTNVINPIPGDNECSLIEAILNANDTVDGQPYSDCAAGDPSGPDTITLAGNTYTFNDYYNNYHGPTALPTISSTVTIQGNGATIERSGAAASFRLMAVGASGDLTLDNVAVTGGAIDGNGGGIYSYAGGLAITNSSVISGNTASNVGGGVASYGYYNPATVTIQNSTISENSANYFGGGVYNASIYDTATVTLSNSTVSGNTAASPGGGIYNYSVYGSAETTIQNSLISGNKSYDGDGGGVSNFGIFEPAAVTVDNSTVSGNNAYYEGGGVSNGAVYQESNLTIQNSSVISGNTSTYAAGGGVANFSYVTATTSIDNSLITGNSAYYVGGGIANLSLLSQAKLTLTNSQVTNNSATQYDGGGINNTGRPYYAYLEPPGKSTQVTISGNPPHRGDFDSSKWREVDGEMIRHHKRGFMGGGLSESQDFFRLPLFNKSAPLTTDSSTISGNSASDEDTTASSQETREGIRRHNRGEAADKMALLQETLEQRTVNAAALGDAATMTIDNSTISGNSARDGGGVSNYSYYGSISLTIQNSSVISGNTALGTDSDGGGVYNNTTSGDALVTIDNSTISGNTAVADNAGGIYNYTITGTATITVNESIISGNNAGDDGAGLYNFSYYSATTMMINDSTISGNAALENGGGMYNLAVDGVAAMAIENSTISGNNAAYGGGGLYNYSVYNSVTSVITNSTISGNSANRGGGIYQNEGSGELNHVTVYNNSATTTGGGLFIANPGVFTLTNSIIAGNAGGGDCSGSINSGGYNLDSDGTCITNGVNNDITSATPGLGLLQVNAPGDTATHALFTSSPALDQIPAGTNGCGTIFVIDQRGVTRPLDGDLDGVLACDMGAFELTGLTESIHLPVIFKSFVSGPDLVIVPNSLVATTNGVTLTIRNDGTASVIDAFWVDVYYNLASPPVLNQQGPVFWGLSVPNGGVPLLPGESVTLTFSSPYFLSTPTPPAAGVTIYGRVDSVGPFSYGAVDETNEGNNVSGPTTSTTALGGQINVDKSGLNIGGLPPRD